MALIIDASVEGASSNAFVTLAEATAFMEARLNGALWTAASVDDTNRAIVEATRELSSRQWVGQRTTTTQALAWPRAWALDIDIPWGGNPYFVSSAIPQRVKDATCELAFQFIKAGTTDVAALDPNIQVIQKVVGPLSTTYAAPYQRAQGLDRYPSVMRYIRPMLASSGASVDVVRG